MNILDGWGSNARYCSSQLTNRREINKAIEIIEKHTDFIETKQNDYNYKHQKAILGYSFKLKEKISSIENKINDKIRLLKIKIQSLERDKNMMEKIFENIGRNKEINKYKNKIRKLTKSKSKISLLKNDTKKIEFYAKEKIVKLHPDLIISLTLYNKKNL